MSATGGAWVAQWAKRLTGSGHDLTACGFEPRVGLCADSSDRAWRLLWILSLSPPLSCSLSKRNEDIKNNSGRSATRTAIFVSFLYRIFSSGPSHLTHSRIFDGLMNTYYVPDPVQKRTHVWSTVKASESGQKLVYLLEADC